LNAPHLNLKYCKRHNSFAMRERTHYLWFMDDKSENEIVPMGSSSFYQSIFQNSAVGQIIVSKNLKLIAANNQMFEYFRMKPCDTKGRLFGCVFRCDNREKGSVCGQGEKCGSCCVRRAVNDILLNRVPIKDSLIRLSFRTVNRHKTKWFLLNGTIIANYVSLSFTDVTELKHKEERLKKRLALDLATGTINKYSLMDSIKKITAPGSAAAGFTVCMIDFDNFKEINDQYGHLMGDHVLEAFSDISRKNIRNQDILGRYGGEEFVFIFPDISVKQSLKILKRIHRELRNTFSKEIKFPVTFSAGLIYVDKGQSDTTQCTDLIGSVDKMLYKAKKHGRNRAVSSMGEFLFSPSDHAIEQ
jgi:diguanylate cyclase (GGDEF)-like protein